MTLSPRQKRWLYQATHRGTKEADHILGSFVRAHIHGLSLEEEKELEKLLMLPDEQIMNFVLKGEALPEDPECPLLQRIRRAFVCQS